MKVCGCNKFYQLDEESTGKDSSGFPVIGRLSDSHLDVTSLISFSTYMNHTVFVKKNGKGFCIGSNINGRIYGDLPKEILKEDTEIKIYDSEKRKCKLISAVCGDDYTLYLVSSGIPSHNQLVYVHSLIREGEPVFLNINGRMPTKIFGGNQTAAAIDQEGGIIMIAKSASIDPEKEIETVFLPNKEKVCSIACLNDSFVVSSSSGTIYDVKVGKTVFNPIKELEGIKIDSVSGSYEHCFALSEDGKVYGRGNNSFGKLGIKRGQLKFAKFTELKDLNNKQKIVSVFAGRSHSLFINTEGKIFACGNNSCGQLLLDKDLNDDSIYLPVETSVKSDALFCIAGSDITVVFFEKVPLRIPNIDKIAINEDEKDDDDDEDSKESLLINLKEEIEKLKLENIKILEENNRLKKEEEKEIIKEKKIKDDYERKLKELSKKEEKLSKELKKSNEEKTLLKNNLAKEMKKSNEQEAEVNLLKEENENLKKIIDRKKDDEIEKIDDDKATEINEENEKLKNKNNELNNENIELKNENIELKNENNELKNENIELKNENIEFKNKLKKVKKENDDLKKIIDQKDKEMKKKIAKEKEELLKENDRLKSDLKKKDEEITKLKELKEENERLKKDLTSKDEENDLLKKQINELKLDKKGFNLIPRLKVYSGEMIDNLEIEGRPGDLGTGATSEVSLVTRKEKLALKMLLPKYCPNDEDDFDFSTIIRFFSEYEVLNYLSRFNHPNIVKVYGFCFGDLTHRPAILLEYCPYVLDKFIKNKEELTNEDRIQIIIEISSAMKIVHECNIIHRDLKPQNIFLDEEKHVKLGDFGICGQLSRDDASTLTQDIGTLAYMAPEILQSRSDYNEKVDVFSFGKVLYQIIAACDLPKQSLTDSLNGKIPSFPPDVTEYSRNLIKKCLALKPDDRPSFESIHNMVKSNQKKIFKE